MGGIGGRYLYLCNLKIKFNLSFDRSLWGCCQYLVADLIPPWVVGISRTVNFGGLRLVFFWAYLYCSLVGWNMGVDPLEWGGNPNAYLFSILDQLEIFRGSD